MREDEGDLGVVRGADYVVNTRHDDVAYVHMSDGTVHCIKPRSSYSFVNDEPMRYADGVRISSSVHLLTGPPRPAAMSVADGRLPV
ncbi:hypothetical protein ACFV9E_40075 [Streptomyces sp. NPDC059835]|uniref:hypothetical protein n=1 Tax=Streptomyces sp. NPDC059835 TaxID=3346967 RepID=UPI003664A2E5